MIVHRLCREAVQERCDLIFKPVRHLLALDQFLPIFLKLVRILFIHSQFYILEAILGLYQKINPSCTGLFDALLWFNVPFTFCKELLVAAITFLIYKRLSPILHGRK